MEPTKEYIYNHEDSMSQNIQIYIQRSKSYIKQNSIRVRIRIQMGLRGLKIKDGVQTLPRPSQKGNLANVITPIPVKIGPSVAEKGGEREKKKNEGEYRGTYSRDWNSAVLAYGLYGGLSGNKRTLL
jgi:hypothetical protein